MPTSGIAASQMVSTKLNIGEGGQEFRDILKIIKDETNDDHLKVGLKNDGGLLKSTSPFINSAVEYISQLGGSVKLWYSTAKNRRRRKYNSNDSAKKVELKKDIEENTDEEIINLINKANPNKGEVNNQWI